VTFPDISSLVPAHNAPGRCGPRSIGPAPTVRTVLNGRLRVLIGTALLILLATWTLMPAASAHDTLISSDPEDGQSLVTSPEQITLTYSDEVLDVSPKVRISDADDRVMVDEAPTIDGPDAVLEIEDPLPAGDYTVQWRVVSADGHPIEGTFSFTVENDSEDPDSEAPSASSADGSTEPPTTMTTDQPSSSVAAEEQSSGSSGTLVVLVIVGVVAVLAVIAVAVIGRRGR
jgi:methionine-rich copper-binding protein CopC